MTIIKPTIGEQGWGVTLNTALDALDTSSSVVRVACRAYSSVNQVCPGSTLVTVILDAESFDTGALHNNVTNNTRMTISVAGVYLVRCQTGTDATGFTGLFILKNGSEYSHQARNILPYGYWSHSDVLTLAIGDYVEMAIDGPAGNIIGSNGDPPPTFMSVVQLV